MNLTKRVSAFLLGAAVALCLTAANVTAADQLPVDLGSAGTYAVLSAAPGGGGAVTCTDSTITGDVGSSGFQAAVVQTRCPITGAIIAPVSAGVVADFNDAYDALAAVSCDPTHTLTGTNFSVVMANGARACNVYWWVAEAATMTTSDFKGTILAGAAITTTGGTFAGRALAKAAVTLTGGAATGCEGSN